MTEVYFIGGGSVLVDASREELHAQADAALRMEPLSVTNGVVLDCTMGEARYTVRWNAVAYLEAR